MNTWNVNFVLDVGSWRITKLICKDIQMSALMAIVVENDNGETKTLGFDRSKQIIIHWDDELNRNTIDMISFRVFVFNTMLQVKPEVSE